LSPSNSMSLSSAQIAAPMKVLWRCVTLPPLFIALPSDASPSSAANPPRSSANSLFPSSDSLTFSFTPFYSRPKYLAMVERVFIHRFSLLPEIPPKSFPPTTFLIHSPSLLTPSQPPPLVGTYSQNWPPFPSPHLVILVPSLLNPFCLSRCIDPGRRNPPITKAFFPFLC